MSSAQKNRSDNAATFPVNLGKPSLRRRLEAYYGQVAPDQIAVADEWKDRFDKIWQKFGGSCEGEQKLKLKLEKKYGVLVRLTIVTGDASAGSPDAINRGQPSQQALLAAKSTGTTQKDEAYFELSKQQKGSGILSFTDANFDPVAALASSPETVVAANHAWLVQLQGSRLDRVDQCRPLLPPTDPLYKKAVAVKKTTAAPRSMAAAPPKIKALPTFAAMASVYKDGPMSILYDAVMRRKRVRILVRYLDGIRGTLTGHLLAFDKHYNMLLRDVEEVYSPHVASESEESRVQHELARRLQSYAADSAVGEDWTCRKRQLRQILVRGDNVVLVYRPDQEQSAWPVTNKSPKDTIYRKQSARRNVPPHERVGTPGSLSLSIARQQSSTTTLARQHKVDTPQPMADSAP